MDQSDDDSTLSAPPLKKRFQEFSTEQKNVIYVVSREPPENSMAWTDLKKGLITCSEKLQTLDLPCVYARKIAEDARKRSYATAMKTSVVAATPWVVPPAGLIQPLMSVHLPPPTYFNSSEGIESNLRNSHDENQMFAVLSQVNAVITQVAEVMGTTVRACVERRKCDNAMCLFTFFQDFPSSIIGGSAVIEEEFRDRPPSPAKIFDSWRMQFFISLKVFIPPPILNRMRRNVDKDSNGEWNIKVLKSVDFQEIVRRILNLKQNPLFEKLWLTKPMDFDPLDAEFANSRYTMIRQIEAEVKAFWTYEKIGFYLKMNV